MSVRRGSGRGLRWAVGLSALLTCAVVLWLRQESDAPPRRLVEDLPRATGVAPRTEDALALPDGPTEDEGRTAAPERAGTREGAAATGSRSANHLRGVTVDTRGNPITEVLVQFIRVTGSPDQRSSFEGRSDAEGRFEIVDLPFDFEGFAPLVTRDGYLPLRTEEARRDEHGAWIPMRLVLSPAAHLAVTVVDVEERPLPGVALSAWVAIPTRSGADAAPDPPVSRAITDLRGRAETVVPAEALLAVHLDGVGWDEPARRCEGNLLTHDLRGEPLVLLPGERRELLVRPGATVLLTGRVLSPQREPVANAHVRVLEGPPEEQGWLDSRHDIRTDELGAFSVAIRGLDPDGELTVIAVDGEFVSLDGRDLPDHGTSRRVLVASWLAEPSPLELVLEPLGAISGHVVDAAGEPVRAVVWAIPAGATYVLQKGSFSFLTVVVARGGEPFELGGLLPGTYDLVVKRDAPRTYHRFPGVRTDEPARDFVIEEDRVVGIRVVVPDAKAGDRGRLLLLRHQPRSWNFGDRPPSGAIHVDGCADEEWARLNLAPLGQADWTRTVEHEDGRTISWVHSMQSLGVRELEPQQVGLYSVGLLAWDGDGRPYARRLSRPLYLTEGEYTFRMSLAPTANLIGSGITGLGPGLEVEVRDARGGVVTTPSGARTTPVTAQGTFRAEQVPFGRLDVRLGTPAGLRVGAAIRSVSVLVDAPGDVEVVFP